MSEAVVETKVCKQCSLPFTITDKDREFYDKISPIFSGKKYSIPDPTFCPDCRQQRRLSFRNERTLYKRTCDMSGKDMISMYSPINGHKVYHPKERRSDKRDPMNYGRDRDMKKSFFQQFMSLFHDVPRVSLYIDNTCSNCDYTNQITHCKDSYLIVSCADSENCLYDKRVNNSTYCVDCLLAVKSHHCYECIDISDCHKCFFCQNSIHCTDAYFLYDCQGCSNCILCTNLRNQSFCIENKKYDKEEYFEKIKEMLKPVHFIDLQKKFTEMKKMALHRPVYQDSTEQSTGDNIQFTKNSFAVFDCFNIEDARYCQFVQDCKDMMDVDYCCCDSSLGYEISTGGIDLYHCMFGIDIRPNVNDLLYCDSCNSNTKNCFGCVGLRNKEYCILNKQYTREEYEILVPQIIEKMKTDGEWGDFFPSHISPFGYNETVANEYFPLTKDEALKKGFKRSDYEAPFPQSDAKDVIICEVSGKPFRLISQEIEFYNKHNLPLPTRHPDVRHAERMALRNPRKLWDRQCAKCGIAIQTSYAPDLPAVAGRPEIVYCEACYNKEIY